MEDSKGIWVTFGCLMMTPTDGVRFPLKSAFASGLHEPVDIPLSFSFLGDL